MTVTIYREYGCSDVETTDFPLATLTFGDDGSLLQVHLKNREYNSYTSHPPFLDVQKLANEIWKMNISEGFFNGRIKYILVTNRDGSGDCSDNYCFTSLNGEGSYANLHSIIDYTDFADSTLEERKALNIRLQGLRNGRYANSGDLLIVLAGPDSGTDIIDSWYWKKSGIQNQPAWSVHGSLSRYESKPVFVLFYPAAQGKEALYQSRIQDFLRDMHPAQTSIGPMVRFTTGHADLFESLVNKSNLILMSKEE